MGSPIDIAGVGYINIKGSPAIRREFSLEASTSGAAACDIPAGYKLTHKFQARILAAQ